MQRFLLGDEQGHIKSLRYAPDRPTEPQEKVPLKIIYTAAREGRELQRLAVCSKDGSSVLSAAFSDGVASAFHLNDDDTVEELVTWNESRLKEQQRFIGLSVTNNRTAFSCTSNGALLMINIPQERVQASPLSSKSAALPTRLRDWKLSVDATKFAYGGDEVELSVWATELAFGGPEEVRRGEDLSTKKRKRNDSLFPGELWRARNVANDALGLRQPVRITSLTILDSTASTTHLMAGTGLGDARRYDTRAGRRPIAEIKSVGRVGGVRVVEKGANDNEVFISDNGSNLFSVDLRNGKIAYGYKGLSGSVNSIAPTPTIMAATALDRFARIYGVCPPPEQVGQQQDHRGQLLAKSFTKSMPTCVVWDGHSNISENHNNDDADDDDEGVWKNMQHIAESDEENIRKHRRKL